MIGGLDGHDVTLIISATIPAFVTLFLGVFIALRQRGHTLALEQINTAVNHQPADGATLVERVVQLETTMERHVEWEHINIEWVTQSLILIARHVGATLPPPPEEGVSA